MTVPRRSGSMRGSKLNLVKQAIKFMIQQLSSTDRLSIVSFDAQAGNTNIHRLQAHA